MPFHPLREALEQAGLTAHRLPSASRFQAEVEAALADFRSQRLELERQVRQGDLTTKVARERAGQLAARLAVELRRRGREAPGAAPVFRDRLAAAARERERARAAASVESLQRQTNAMLKQLLVEQQIAGRAGEFEARAFVRQTPSAVPAPTLDSLLDFHAWATQAGDEAAREWCRRQLEAFRPRVFNPEDHRRIDVATDRPERVNPRIVAAYVEALRDQPAEVLETFVDETIASGDANASVAVFAMAREAPEGLAARWVRSVIENLGKFPDAAIETLRSLEADAWEAERAAALAQAEHAIAIAESEARLAGLEMPSPEAIARAARLAAIPLAAADEPIGLAPNRRGMNATEYRDFARIDDEPTRETGDAVEPVDAAPRGG